MAPFLQIVDRQPLTHKRFDQLIALLIAIHSLHPFTSLRVGEEEIENAEDYIEVFEYVPLVPLFRLLTDFTDLPLNLS